MSVHKHQSLGPSDEDSDVLSCAFTSYKSSVTGKDCFTVSSFANVIDAHAAEPRS